MLTLTQAPAEPTTPHGLTRSEELADAEAAIAAAHDARHYASEAKRISRHLKDDPERQMAERARVTAEACGTNPQTGEPYYTAEDFLAELKKRQDEGYAVTKLGEKTWVSLQTIESVPNMRLRDEYLRQVAAGEMNARSLAEHIGEMRKGHHNGTPIGDHTTVERMLGLTGTSNGDDRPPTLRLFVPADLAARLADGLGMTYQDAGV